MAGNVKEWCWTETNRGRFLVGGAWNDTKDKFATYDAKGPFERAPDTAFVWRSTSSRYRRPWLPRSGSSRSAVTPERNNRSAMTSSRCIGDSTAYDSTPLSVVEEATEETAIWRRHTVVIHAAYGAEHMRVHLFLPKHGSAPYQTVIFFPPGDAFVLPSSRDLSLRWGEFILRSGRAFVYPVYKGTYERATPDTIGVNEDRELRIAWSRDLGRAIDYLWTRPDIDRDRLAFYAVSAANGAVVLTALEPRLKTSVLSGAGIVGNVPPEWDALNYAPRIGIPTLMLNGRYDSEVPLETAQRPLFDLLGTPAERKRHQTFETAHTLRIEDMAGEILPVAGPLSWTGRALITCIGRLLFSSYWSAAEPISSPPESWTCPILVRARRSD